MVNKNFFSQRAHFLSFSIFVAYFKLYICFILIAIVLKERKLKGFQKHNFSCINFMYLIANES